MSERWPGGIVRSTPVTPTGPLQNGTAPGVWSLADAAYWTKQGLWPTAGNTLAVEDVFSTWLYTGNGSTQTITNGINLSGQGGLVWFKYRAGPNGPANHQLYDTARGVQKKLATNTTGAEATELTGLTAFNANGFSFGSDGNINASSSDTYASWTFREAPNFFDVVTYTGNGVAGRQIAHNLGVAPGMMIVKMTSAAESWYVYHRGTSSPATKALVLNTTAAENAGSVGYWNSTNPTSTNFTLGSNYEVNNNGSTYVAYLFAHDATSDGIIQCGGYAGTGAVQSINLGWEPQWLLVKNVTNTGNWNQFDNMRGMAGSNTGSNALLNPNLSAAESTTGAVLNITATGFTLNNTNTNYNGSGENYIYMAIRRGPMRTPTLGTSVFAPTLATFSGSTVTNTGFVVDMAINKNGVASTGNNFVLDRLRGSDNGSAQQTISTNTTSAEVASSGRAALTASSVTIQNGFLEQNTTANNIVWAFRRAPGFFDEVCYTGTGVTNRTVNHNLGVKPELIIIKRRTSAAAAWFVAHTFVSASYYSQVLNTTAQAFQTTYSSYSDALYSDPTATEFKLGTEGTLNGNGDTFVSYLFASAPGVSKVGSYTGNGSSQTINCAFTTGSRFVLIKRTDSTGDWYVWDSARGIVAGNDPYLALNSTAAEVTTNDSVDTDNTGFIVNQVAASNVNVNGATYIFLAIA